MTTTSTATAGATVPAVAGGRPERLASFVGRAGAAYAALGGGLVLVALGAEHLGHLAVLGAATVALGLAEIAWALAALRGPVPAPRPALAVLLGGAVGWLAAAVGATGTLTGADAAAAALQVASAVLLAVALRPSEGGRAPGPLVRVGILAVTSLAVAAVTVPGLAATDAGAHAPAMHGMGGMHGMEHHGHG